MCLPLLVFMFCVDDVDIDFDVPTDIELLDLLSKTKEFTDSEDDEDDEPLAI